MGAKQNFNLGGINSHFNGLKDAGNMSPTQLALTYSKEQLQHMAQMGVINPTNAVIAGMNIDRISNTNAPPTSTVSQDTLAPQQPQQGQLPQQPPQGQPPQQGGLMSIPRPGQKYQQGGVVAFSNKGEVELDPKYGEPGYGNQIFEEEPLYDPEKWNRFTPKRNKDKKDTTPINEYTPMETRRNPKDLEGIYGKGGEKSAVGGPGVTSLTQRPAQSARPGAGAGNPPAAPVLSNVDPAFLAMLKERGGQPMMARENVQEGSNDALNRALIRGGAAMMANRDPAIGSGLQGFLQTAGKGATEGLTGYEQQVKEFKDRKLKQNELEATERYRTRANDLDAARTGVLYGVEKDKATALPIAAEKEQQMHKTVAQIQAGAKPYDLDQEYMNPNTTPERRKQIEHYIAVKNQRASARDFSPEQQTARAKLWHESIRHQPENANLTPAALAQKEYDYIYGGIGGGGYQPTKEQLAIRDKYINK